MNGLTMRFGATALKRALLLGVIGALLTSFMVAQAVTTDNLGTTTLKLPSQTFTSDSAITVVSNGVKVIPSTDGTPVGSTSPGVTITSSLPEVTTAVTKNNYAYEFVVKEAGNATLTGTEKYKIEVYGDNGSTNSLLATFYMQQGDGGYVNRCVNDIRRRPSQPLIQWRFHPHTVHRGRRLRSTQGPSDA